MYRTCCGADMKIRIPGFPAKNSPVGIGPLLNVGPDDVGCEPAWDIFGGLEAVPLSARKFASEAECKDAARDGFKVFEHPASQAFAKDLIKTGWAVEVKD
jgi:hypothetical protein